MRINGALVQASKEDTEMYAKSFGPTVDEQDSMSYQQQRQADMQAERQRSIATRGGYFNDNGFWVGSNLPQSSVNTAKPGDANQPAPATPDPEDKELKFPEDVKSSILAQGVSTADFLAEMKAFNAGFTTGQAATQTEMEAHGGKLDTISGNTGATKDAIANLATAVERLASRPVQVTVQGGGGAAPRAT
jgi:hypothetical protein